jgi:hypothetical protein
MVWGGRYSSAVNLPSGGVSLRPATSPPVESGGRVFIVLDEVARDVRAPAVQGVRRVPLAGFPGIIPGSLTLVYTPRWSDDDVRPASFPGVPVRSDGHAARGRV